MERQEDKPRDESKSEKEATLHELNYEAPTSLDQAISVLAAAGENGAYAGRTGTDLIIQMRAGGSDNRDR